MRKKRIAIKKFLPKAARPKFSFGEYCLPKARLLRKGKLLDRNMVASVAAKAIRTIGRLLTAAVNLARPMLVAVPGRFAWSGNCYPLVPGLFGTRRGLHSKLMLESFRCKRWNNSLAFALAVSQKLRNWSSSTSMRHNSSTQRRRRRVSKGLWQSSAVSKRSWALMQLPSPRVIGTGPFSST